MLLSFIAANERGDIEGTSVLECLDSLTTCLPETIILVELGSLSAYSQIQKDDLRSLYFYTTLCCSIVSPSSGSYRFQESGAFTKTLDSILKWEAINFVPFSLDEFKVFKGVNLPPNSAISDEEYEELTYYNPYLLSILSSCTTVDAAKCLLKETMQVLITDIEESLQSKGRWIEESFSNCIEFLESALNGDKLNIKKLKETYASTWVCAESVLYIRKEDEEHFVLGMSFPNYFWRLIKRLHAQAQT